MMNEASLSNEVLIENRMLRERITELEEQLEKERKDSSNSKKQNKKLTKEVNDLKKELAKLKGSAPLLASSDKTAEAGGVPSSKVFYKRNRSADRRKPTGGQSGHTGHGRRKPVPNSPPITVQLEECHICGRSTGIPSKGAEQTRTITDIPLPYHIVYEVIFPRYWCSTCKRLVRGNLPWIPPNQQFGPLVACWISFHRMLGLTVGKIRLSLFETYGISMSDDTVLKLEKWVADVLHDDYEKIKENVVKAYAVNADETSFRINGENGWLWVFVHTLGALYVVAPTRGHTVPEEILKGFNGVLGRDAWKPYDVVKCSGHQLDLLHINRWLERAELHHGVEPRTLLTSRHRKLTRPGRPPEKFLEFIDGVRSILKRAVEFTEKNTSPSLKKRTKAWKQFKEEMNVLTEKKWKDKDAIRISKELRRRLNMLFTFVKMEDIPWHNNDAERAIRKGVLARKVSGGRRTWTGAETFQILLSVYETSKKKGENFIQLAMRKIGVPSAEIG